MKERKVNPPKGQNVCTDVKPKGVAETRIATEHSCVRSRASQPWLALGSGEAWRAGHKTFSQSWNVNRGCTLSEKSELEKS